MTECLICCGREVFVTHGVTGQRPSATESKGDLCFQNLLAILLLGQSFLASKQALVRLSWHYHKLQALSVLRDEAQVTVTEPDMVQ